MKNLIVVLICFIAVKGFTQTNELKTEEKSSGWIKITEPAVVKPKNTAIASKKKTDTNKPSVPKQDAQEDFNKTNNQVNRFKKGKKS